jgi:spore coat polysaccharide biosynthesis protein SpsF
VAHGSVVAIIQARMSSARLPGKVLADLGAHTVLSLLVARLRTASALDGVIVATSSDPSDDPLALATADLGLPCHRGPLDDVAARFAGAIESCGAWSVVRVCADSPFLDPRLVDAAVALHRASDVDLTTNAVPRTYPPGQSVDVVTSEAFVATLDAMKGAHREHVTSYLHEHIERFRSTRIVLDPATRVSMAVDTADDLVRARAAYAVIGGRRIVDASWSEVLAALADARRG